MKTRKNTGNNNKNSIKTPKKWTALPKLFLKEINHFELYNMFDLNPTTTVPISIIVYVLYSWITLTSIRHDQDQYKIRI